MTASALASLLSGTMQRRGKVVSMFTPYFTRVASVVSLA